MHRELCFSNKNGSMINQQIQAAKASAFRDQHYGGKLLVLPNIWDFLGARLIEKIGFPSVATASVSTALSNGYRDGEHIPFPQLLKTVNKIAQAVDLPVTVDIERGFADSIPHLKENIHLLIENGAVGINIEDSLPAHDGLYSIEDQCKKIEAIRETGLQYGVPLVINARTDVFVLKMDDALNHAVERGLSFRSAGADCIYPILMNDYTDITRFLEKVDSPVNVLLQKPVSDLRSLENAGVARLSLGPNFLNHALTAMKNVAEGLMHYDSSAFFDHELLPREYLDLLVY
jgi:2-methylisocitrate lyase-like PEP mutase family enzyme